MGSTNHHLSSTNNPFIPSPLHLSRRLYKSDLFMQNKPNLMNAKIYVTSFLTKAYENQRLYGQDQNKPNQTQSNPIYRRIKVIKLSGTFSRSSCIKAIPCTNKSSLTNKLPAPACNCEDYCVNLRCACLLQGLRRTSSVFTFAPFAVMHFDKICD
jgi:hypothetical protein